MQRKNFGRRSGVILDWCGSHGTWLDADEMGDVAAFVLEGGLEREPAAGGGGGGEKWSLPADPGRTAAILAAEQLIAEERARSAARTRDEAFGSDRVFRGLGDFLAQLLK